MQLTERAKDVVIFLARIALALIFVIAGIHKIATFSETAALLASQGVPMAEAMLAIATVVELSGGLMVLLGWKARWGALLLFLFIIPVTYVFHSFWTYEATDMANQVHHFLKNLAIMGGCLYVIVYGSGAFSLDKLEK